MPCNQDIDFTHGHIVGRLWKNSHKLGVNIDGAQTSMDEMHPHGNKATDALGAFLH